MKEYRPWTPKQSFLLPPSPLDWLPPTHPVYFILDVVEQLDLSAIDARLQAKDHRGQRPYSPRMMTALLLYAYCMGVFSSRRIARATHEDIAFRILCGGEHPFFTTINQFRLEHLEALKGLFLDVLKLCRRAGLVRLGHVSLDGSKVRANASKHKAMSYDRMLADEKKLAAEIQELLARAQQQDDEEDARLGEVEAEEDLPSELARREARLCRILEAKAALEAEAAEARAEQLRANAAVQRERSEDESLTSSEKKRASTRAEKSQAAAAELDAKAKHGDDDDESTPGSTSWPKHRVPTQRNGSPKPEAQRNFTDPDSRIMVSDGAFVQAYNAQIAVDDAHQVIVAAGVSNQPPDQEHLGPMLDRVASNTGAAPEKLSADAGYFSVGNVARCMEAGTDPHIAPGRERRSSSAEPAPPTTPGEVARAKMRQKLATQEGRDVYARRKCIAEPPLGQIKEARHFRRFSLRGLTKVGAEWALVCATHNLLKLYRAAWLPEVELIATA